VWIIALAMVISFSIFYHYKFTLNKPVNQSNKKDFLTNSLKPAKSIFSYILIGGFCLFICLYIYLILYGEDFAYVDSAQFTSVFVQGKFVPMPIFPSIGRFWAFGHQEYNFISLFTTNIIAYHLFSIVQLLITILLCYGILSPIKLSYRLFILTIIITYPSSVLSFFYLIFPERNIIFWLAVLIFCLVKYQTNKSLLFFIGIFISTQFLLYYKEPVFLLILGYAFSSLFYNLFQEKIWQKPRQKLLNFLSNNWINLGLIFLGLVYVFLYIHYTFGQVDTYYNQDFDRQQTSIFSTLIKYVLSSPILLIFMIFFPLRLVYLCRKKDNINPLWDCFAFGTLLYFLAYVKLNMFERHYIAPVDFIILLYLVKVNVEVFNSKNKYKLVIITGLLSLIFFINLYESSYTILFRKKFIDLRVQTADYIKNHRENNPSQNATVLFFPSPYISPYNTYNIMEFISYLNYKNFPVAIKNIPQNQDTIITKATEKFADNLCFQGAGLDFECLEAQKPDHKDLIIFLTPTKVVEEYEKKATKVFHYQPEFKGIEKILYLFAKQKIDKEWLWFNGYIFTNFQENSLSNKE
jgi:hypothetical protein